MKIAALINKSASQKVKPFEIASRIVHAFTGVASVLQVKAEANGFINFLIDPKFQHELQRNDAMDTLEQHTEQQQVAPLPTHQLKIQLVPSEQAFSSESYLLYKKYQIAVHKSVASEITEKSFKGFLLDSPLNREPLAKAIQITDSIGGLPGVSAITCGSFNGYGSYHVQYRLDGKLVMVAVVDILPHCLSSVYVYYDPDISFLSPGIFSALGEINYVKCISKVIPQLYFLNSH